jgi:enterochelin esterase family protein
LFGALACASILVGCSGPSPGASSDDMESSPDARIADGGHSDDIGGAPDWTLTLHPLDRGLGSGPVSQHPAVTLAAEGSIASARFVWPAGLWTVELQSASGRRATIAGSDMPAGLAREDAMLAPLSEASPTDGALPIFSALDEEVVVHTDGQTLSIERVAEPVTVDWDAPPSRAGGGELVDAALSELREDPGDIEPVERLVEQLRERGVAPMLSSRGAFFVAPFTPMPGEPPPEVRGSFTGWEGDPRAELRRVLGALWGRFIEIPDGESSYKIVYGDGALWYADPGNRHVRWDGVERQGPGSFNSIVHPSPERGRLIWIPEVASEQLGDRRDVYVYLPPGYEARSDGPRYPTLYVHDGNESITRAHFDEVADAFARDHGPDARIVMVFVALPSQQVRMQQYTVASADARGEDYARFVAETIVPMVDKHFRSRPERDARGLVGASLGGLISYWTAAAFPSTFEYTAGMSSSFFWADDVMVRTIARRGCQELSYYLDSGSPGDNFEITREMRDTLERLGCRRVYVHDEGARHEWGFWRDRLPGVLEAFRDVYDSNP